MDDNSTINSEDKDHTLLYIDVLGFAALPKPSARVLKRITTTKPVLLALT